MASFLVSEILLPPSAAFPCAAVASSEQTLSLENLKHFDHGYRQSNGRCQMRVGCMGLGWRENQLLVLLLLSYDPAFYGEISGQVPSSSGPGNTRDLESGPVSFANCRLPKARGAGVTSGFPTAPGTVFFQEERCLAQGSSSLAASLILSFPAHSQGSS